VTSPIVTTTNWKLKPAETLSDETHDYERETTTG
jgi:hypothetical protein